MFFVFLYCRPMYIFCILVHFFGAHTLTRQNFPQSQLTTFLLAQTKIALALKLVMDS